MEFCSLRVGNVDLKTGKVEVEQGVRGGAKGGKGRTVFLGKTARQAVWRYLAGREDNNDSNAPLFLAKGQHPMTPNGLRHLIIHLAEKAGVKDAYPHKFRHTFSITYLRSGGDVFTLQALLGHATLDMVRHYAQIAEIDVQNAHQRASPADNWRLWPPFNYCDPNYVHLSRNRIILSNQPVAKLCSCQKSSQNPPFSSHPAPFSTGGALTEISKKGRGVPCYNSNHRFL